MFGVSNSHTHNLCERVDLALAFVGHGDLHGAGGVGGSGRRIQHAGCRCEASQQDDNDGSEDFLHEAGLLYAIHETTFDTGTFVPDCRTAGLWSPAADQGGREANRVDSPRCR